MDTPTAPAAGAATGGAAAGAPPGTPGTARTGGKAPAKVGQLAAEAEAAATPEAAPVKLRVKYKDDGKEYEEELGAEEVAQARRQSRWAQRSAEKAARIEKEHQQLLETLKDPKRLREALKAHGHDPDKLGEDWVTEKYTPLTMTPEQLQQYQLQQQLKAREEELEGYRTKEQQAADERQASAFRKQVDEQLAEIAKLDRVPKNPRALARLADVWEGMHENGYEPTPKELEAEIFNTYAEDFRALRGEKKGAPLLSLARQLMGEDVVKELQRAALEEFRTKTKKPAPQGQQAQQGRQQPQAQRDTARRPGESFEEHWNRVHG